MFWLPFLQFLSLKRSLVKINCLFQDPGKNFIEFKTLIIANTLVSSIWLLCCCSLTHSSQQRTCKGLGVLVWGLVWFLLLEINCCKGGWMSLFFLLMPWLSSKFPLTSKPALPLLFTSNQWCDVPCLALLYLWWSYGTEYLWYWGNGN